MSSPQSDAEKLNAFVDGELPGPEAAAIVDETHRVQESHAGQECDCGGRGLRHTLEMGDE